MDCITIGINFNKRTIEILLEYPRDQCQLLAFPHEIIHTILFNLQIKDITKFSLLSKEIHEITSHNDLWGRLYFREFQSLPKGNSFIKTYEENYRYRSNLSKDLYVEEKIIIRNKIESQYCSTTVDNTGIFYFTIKSEENDNCLGEGYEIGRLDLTTLKLLDPLHKLPAVDSLCIDDNKLYCISLGCRGSSTIFILDLNTEDLLDTLNFQNISAFTVYNGMFFLAEKDSNDIFIWNKILKSTVKVLSGHSKMIHCLSVSDNKLFSGSEDETIRIWDLKTYGFTILNFKDLPTSLLFTNDLSLVAMGEDSVEMWDCEAKISKDILSDGSIRTCVFWNDKVVYATSDDDEEGVKSTIHIQNFKTTDLEILKGIAFKLRNTFSNSIINVYSRDHRDKILYALKMFERIPKTIKARIFEEFYSIISRKAHFLNREQTQSLITTIKFQIDKAEDDDFAYLFVITYGSLSPPPLWNYLEQFMQALESYISIEEAEKEYDAMLIGSGINQEDASSLINPK